MYELNRCIFSLKMMSYWKNNILFGITSAVISKKVMMASPSDITFFFENQKKNLMAMKLQIFRLKNA